MYPITYVPARNSIWKRCSSKYAITSDKDLMSVIYLKFPVLQRVSKIYLAATAMMLIAGSLIAQSNYQYDADGRLIADLSEGIVRIEWNNMSKITQVVRVDTSHAADLEFAYSPTGDRIMKLVKPRTGQGLAPEKNWKYTYYVYNTAGNVVSTYERNYDEVPNQDNLYRDRYVMSERYIGIQDRLGCSSPNILLVNYFFTAAEDASGRFINVQESGMLPPPLTESSTLRGMKQYELVNHIDNILAVVGDRKILQDKPVGYQAFVSSATDYYPFGMEMYSRTYHGEAYHYGFSRKERDNEIKGKGNSYDFGGRSIYDPRLGRFVSVDPQYRKGPDFSPYSFAFNSPISFLDKNGEWPWDYRCKDLISKDTGRKTAFIYGILDGALNLGVEGSKQFVKNNPAFVIFFAGEKWDQAKMIYELATNSELQDNLIKQFNDELDNIGGLGTSAEVGYARGKLVFGIATMVVPAAKGVQALSAASKSTKITAIGAEATAIAVKAGCFLGDTEIRVAGDKFIYIRDIRTEENLYIVNENELKERGILKADQDMIKIIIDHWELVVASDQLFLVKEEWKKAEDLKRGDKVAKVHGGFVKIKRVIHQGKASNKKLISDKSSKAFHPWWKKKKAVDMS